MLARLILWVLTILFPRCLMSVYTGPLHYDHAGEFIYVYEWTDERLGATSYKRLDDPAYMDRDFELEEWLIQSRFIRCVTCRKP